MQDFPTFLFEQDKQAFKSSPQQTLKSANQKLGATYKGVNEFIGMLQVASSKLNQMLKILLACSFDQTDITSTQIPLSELSIKTTQALSEVEEILKAQFLGTAIFDAPLSTHILDTHLSICIQSPMALAPDIKAMATYIEEKLQEVQSLLALLSEMLTQPTNAQFENIDSQNIAKIFKG